MNPPSYESIESGEGKNVDPWTPHKTTPTRLNLRDEVHVSRVQRVAALVAQLLPHIRARARQGLSKTRLLVLPSDARDSTNGQLVGFPEESVPLVIQLEDVYDDTQFWTQDGVLALLHEQILVAVADGITKPDAVEDKTLRTRPMLEPRPSLWGRGQSKAVAIPTVRPDRPPVSVNVERDLFSFRAESQYGLFETQRTRAVLVTVDVA